MIDEKKVIAIAGSGGGGGKGKGGGDEPANTLRSNARARIVDLISEGPIEGLVDGEKSIYYDETPIKGLDGSYNIKGVTSAQRFGTPDQTHLNNVPTVDTPVSVEVRVKQNEAAPIRTIVDESADAVRVIMRIPALLKRNKKTGEIEPTSVNYAIDVRPSGGTWTEVVNQNIVNQKTSSPYQKAHYIPLPFGGAPWDIRVRRITVDSTTTDLQNETWWEAYFILVEGKFIYPNSALVYTEVDAEKFGQQIPQRYYHVKGRKISVPVNYDPVTRVYTGIWNGTFKTAWTNNPAWIFYDLLTHDRYGLGEFIDAAKVDKWSLYQIAQYCDQLIPSGYKDVNGDDIMEPRFTFNGVINSREEAHSVLQSIINTWRGMAYWSLGQVFATADMPSDPVKLVSPANVIDGHFSYSGTAMKARHSVAIVQWNDPNDFYRPSYEVVINDDMLQRYGWRETEVTLRGCTSRGMAHRYGKWILDVEQNETETIEYQASWDHADVRPGSIIAVTDPNKAAVRAGGRIALLEDGNTRVTLDGDFEPGSGATYNLMVELPDGSIDTKTITSFLPMAVDETTGVENFVSMEGVVDGTLGVTGQLPYGWVYTGRAGISITTESHGVLSDGRPYFDLRIQGSATSDGSIYFRPSDIADNPLASTGDVWSTKVSTVRLAGSFTGFVNDKAIVYLREYVGTTNGSTSFNSTTLMDINSPLSAEKDIVLTRTLSDVGTTNVGTYVYFGVTAGVPVDVTVSYIGYSLQKTASIDSYIGPAKYRIVKLSSALSTTPVAGAMWAITGTDIAPRQYRVLGISEEDPHVVKITALFHDPTKYARVEQDLFLPPPTYYKPKNTIAPPTNLSVDETQYVRDGKTFSRVLLSWTPSDDFMAKAYRVSMDTPDGSNIKLGDIANTSIDIDDITAGDYVFYVSAVSISGRVSSAAFINHTATGWIGTTLPTVSDLQIEGQGTNTSFGGNSVRFTWKNNLAGSNQVDTSEEENNGVSPFYRDNVIKIYDTATNTLLRTQYVTTDSYTYSYDRNYADNASLGRSPTRSFRIEVAVRDTLGRTSAYVPLSVSNALPDAVSFSVDTTISALVINVTKPADADFAGVKVWAETTSTFNQSVTVPKYDGPSTSVVIPATPGATYYVRVAAYDAFDKLNLNVAPYIMVTTPIVSVDTVAPAVPTGLAVTSDVVVSASGTEQVKLIATWNANSETDLAYYGVNVKEAAGQFVPFMTNGNRLELTVRAGVQYTVAVRAVDITGNASSYCTSVAHTTVRDTVAPATPLNFTAQAGFKSIWLSWSANTEADLAKYEIYASSTTTAPVAGTAATFTSGSTVMEHSGLAAGVTRNYWIRAVDSSGNKSAWSSMISATTVNIQSIDVQGVIDMTSFAASIRPPRVVTSLPTLPNASYSDGDTVVLTTDGKLYRMKSGAWTVAVDGADIVANSITAAQIAVGAIGADQIAANAITASKMLIGDTSNIYPDFNMLDVDYYSSSTGHLYSFIATNTGNIGRNYFTGQSTTAYTSHETDWFDIQVSADYRVEGECWFSSAPAVGEDVNLYVEYGTLVGSTNVVTPTRRELVMTRSGTYGGAGVRGAINITTTSTERRARFVLEKEATATANTARMGGLVVRRRANGVLIVDGSISASHLVTGSAVITGTAQIADAIISTAKISDLAVTGAKIANATIDSAKISTITADKITVSGSTTLADWRLGTGATIDGAKIAANTILANSLIIGIRGVEVESIEFEHNDPATNQVSWTTGVIRYMSDAGALSAKTITAGSGTWSSGILYIYWVKDATTLSTTTSATTAFGTDNVILAVYKGGTDLVTDYGRVIIDGGKIKANTITASQIAANTITGAKIAANTITAGNIVAATITGTEIAANSITTDKIAIGDFKNLFVDGNFLFMGAYGKTTWYEMSAAISVVDRATLTGTAAAAPSRYVAVVDRPLAAALSAYGSTGAAWMPCKAGDQFYIACDALTSATLVGTNLSRMIIYWLLTDGSTSSNTYYFNPTTAWATYGTTYTAPTGAIAARTRIYFDATTTETSTLYMTNFFCCNLIDGGVLIENGTITATKLNVSTLSAISANIGTCTAGMIRSSDSKLQVDLTNKRILILD